MANSINKNQFIISSICILVFFGAGSIGRSLKTPKIVISKQSTALNFNSDLLKLMSLGQKRVIADLLWITTLLEADIEQYESNDLNSWLYLRFKTLFELDPKFLSGYRFAGQYLSIVKDDLEGAKEIFEKALANYPDDYQLNLDAGFLYGFELGDYEKAKKAYKKVLMYPYAPDFLRSIVHKFDYEITNDKTLTFKLLKDTYQNLADESYLKKRVKSDLYALKAQIDLECLNSGKDGCSKIDFYGNDYYIESGIYKSRSEFDNYRLKKKKRE